MIDVCVGDKYGVRVIDTGQNLSLWHYRAKTNINVAGGPS